MTPHPIHEGPVGLFPGGNMRQQLLGGLLQVLDSGGHELFSLSAAACVDKYIDTEKQGL